MSDQDKAAAFAVGFQKAAHEMGMSQEQFATFCKLAAKAKGATKAVKAAKPSPVAPVKPNEVGPESSTFPYKQDKSASLGDVYLQIQKRASELSNKKYASTDAAETDRKNAFEVGFVKAASDMNMDEDLFNRFYAIAVQTSQALLGSIK